MSERRAQAVMVRSEFAVVEIVLRMIPGVGEYQRNLGRKPGGQALRRRWTLEMRMWLAHLVGELWEAHGRQAIPRVAVQSASEKKFADGF